MTKTIDLPLYDVTGNLTPLVVAAMTETGATSAHHPTDPDKITLTFAKLADAKAFLAAVTAQGLADEASEDPSTPDAPDEPVIEPEA